MSSTCWTLFLEVQALVAAMAVIAARVRLLCQQLSDLGFGGLPVCQTPRRTWQGTDRVKAEDRRFRFSGDRQDAFAPLDADPFVWIAGV